ncbi:helix-turn-helix domain-containing protein [Halobacillus faecis]|uniref:Putative HTH-type transcriptional regulator y4dJ n=1 Tax=Halobacillus faecis TaxID=360184 RepID=A0A511WUL3_9BACI|nr:helix-turn-helix transcriptional regulator [Halobacillus faecis]GEN54607.1 putative HTH-type transcriptional regulator y4dJ [Halobacillus faecis]
MKHIPQKLIRKTVGKQLRTLRLEKGLSQEELAYRAGMHHTYISGIERGRRNPSITNFYYLAHALEVHPKQLIPSIELTIPGEEFDD